MTDRGTILDKSTKDNPSYTMNCIENKLNKYLEKKKIPVWDQQLPNTETGASRQVQGTEKRSM